MRNTECKKVINNTLKDKLSDYSLNDVIFKYSKNAIELEFSARKFGFIEIKYLTGTHIPYGALVALTLSVVITDGIIWDYLNKMNLSFCRSGVYHNFVFNQFSSNLTNYSFFRNRGVVAFYPNDNIKEKADELFINIEKFFFEILSFIGKVDLSLIDNVLDFPERYAYPATISLIVCHLNNKPEIIDSIISKIKKKRVSDSSENKLKEIIEKLK